MKLSPHFDLNEFTDSEVAAALGIDNEPSPAELENLSRLAAVLEVARRVLGHPIVVTSGFRCRELNAAVGGASNSHHLLGCAADIKCPGFGSAYAVAQKLEMCKDELGIGQLIYEAVGASRWVHVSVHDVESPSNRVLTYARGNYQVGIQPVHA
jgi:zinc D-Ala-D-Ala carboxypeptidase